MGWLEQRLGTPFAGVVLGSGFAELAQLAQAGEFVPADEIPDYPHSTVDGHDGGVSAARVDGKTVWFFHGRVHLYEGRPLDEVVAQVECLAAAGGERILLTCAAGGLAAAHRPGDLVLVSDHINLTGTDPLARIPVAERHPAFLDLQQAYDAELRRALRAAAAVERLELQEGVLAATAGPSYETPAEVRMLQGLGVSVVTMSTVPETIIARYRGLRVAAIACIANPGAGLDGAKAIEHEDVLCQVAAAVGRRRSFWRAAIGRLVADYPAAVAPSRSTNQR